LLDAGVPLVSPVAGVSVGLAPSSNELLLDITGTEVSYVVLCLICLFWEVKEKNENTTSLELFMYDLVF